jgi:hypothetical protein
MSKHPTKIPREDRLFAATRLVRRSRPYFVTPIILIAILTTNLIWEATRENLPARTLAERPFYFTVLNISTTATVLAVIAGLFAGRLQWAHTLKPHIGSAIDDENAAFRIESREWRFWLYNAGPGGAVIEEISYYVRFIDDPEEEKENIEWVSLHVLNDQLRSRNLRDGKDYFMRWNSGPLPAVKSHTEGRNIAWFSIGALSRLRILDAQIKFSDTLGDSYETIFPLMHRLPSVVISAIADERKKNP